MSTLATPARPRAKSPIGTKNEATERADPPAPVSGAPWGNAVGGVVVGAEEGMGALVVVTTEGEVVDGVVVGEDVADVVVVDEAKRHVGTVTELSSIVTAPVI